MRAKIAERNIEIQVANCEERKHVIHTAQMYVMLQEWIT
jgi:hypothetical protein